MKVHARNLRRPELDRLLMETDHAGAAPRVFVADARHIANAT